MKAFSRRGFLKLTAAASAVGALPAAAVVEPFSRGGSSRLRISLAAYSLRDFFPKNVGQKLDKAARQIDMAGFLDYCADLGVEGAEMTGYFLPTAGPEPLKALRRHAFLRGVSISGTAVKSNFALPRGAARDAQIAELKQWIDRASVLGAPHIRVFAGEAPAGFPIEEASALCIEALEECGAYAGERGVFLGVENHGGIVADADSLLAVVRGVKNPWVGINLDTANFITPDPYEDIARCAPFAVNVQVKGEMETVDGKPRPLADLKRIAGILRDVRYQGWVAVEYESAEDAWAGIPKLLAKMREAFGVAAVAGATAASEWRELFDGRTLAGWKATDYAGAGEVSVRDGCLWLESGSELTGANLIEATPRSSYEVELEAKRVSGADFFCALTIPVGAKCGTFIVGGWGGGLVGFSSLDGSDASENETTRFLKFEAGRWYKIRLRVSTGKLEGWIDDEPVLSVDLEGRKVGMRLGEIERSQPFGISTFRTTGAIRAIRLRKI